jgi:hypothetical protein
MSNRFAPAASVEASRVDFGVARVAPFEVTGDQEAGGSVRYTIFAAHLRMCRPTVTGRRGRRENMSTMKRRVDVLKISVVNRLLKITVVGVSQLTALGAVALLTFLGALYIIRAVH